MARKFPKKLPDHPLIIKAKVKEIRRWKNYDTVEKVTKMEEMHVISSSCLVKEKQPGVYRARLVVRGFEEDVFPQSK